MINSKETKYKYLAKNTALFTISNFGSKFLTFFLTLLYTRVLTTSEYGTADIINTTATLCIYTLTLTVANSVMRFSIEDVDRSDLVLYYGLKVLVRGTSILLIGVAFIRTLHIIPWEDYCYVFLILIFFTHALEEIFNYYLRAIDKIQAMVITSLTSSGVKLLTSILFLIVVRLGIMGYLVSLVMGPICAIIVAAVYIFPLNHTVATKDELKCLHSEIIRYSIPAAVNAIGWWVAGSVDRYFLVAMEGASVNGIYSVAYKIPAIMGTISNIFGQAWGLSAIREYNKETKKDDNGFFEKMFSLYVAIIFTICSVFILMNVPIAKVMFADEFFESWKYSPLLVLGTGFNCLAVYFGGIFSAAKHNVELAYSMVASMLTNVVLNAVLIPRFSATGAAIATLVSYYVVLVTRYMFSRRYLMFRTHLFREHFAIALIIVQIIMDRQPDHAYIVQSIILLAILGLYHDENFSLIKKILEAIKKARG